MNVPSKPGGRVQPGWPYLLLMIVAFALIVFRSWPPSGIGLFLIIAVPIIYPLVWLFTFGPPGRRRQRRQMAARIGESIEVEWEITSDRLRVSDSKEDESSFSWSSVEKVVRIPTGFLLYSNPVTFNWIPLTGFSSLEDIEMFAELSSVKAKMYIEAHEVRGSSTD